MKDNSQGEIHAAGNWISACEAYELVCERNGAADAAFAIARRAHAGLIRTWAALSTRQLLNAQRKKETATQASAELSKDFWWAEGEAALEQDWAAGDFRTCIYEKFPLSGEYDWRAFGVKFDRAGIEAMLASERLTDVDPDWKGDREGEVEPRRPIPSDGDIQAKMKELHELGVDRDVAAKLIRQIAGFEGVGNEHARRVIRGILPRGRPKKRQQN